MKIFLVLLLLFVAVAIAYCNTVVDETSTALNKYGSYMGCISRAMEDDMSDPYKSDRLGMRWTFILLEVERRVSNPEAYKGSPPIRANSADGDTRSIMRRLGQCANQAGLTSEERALMGI